MSELKHDVLGSGPPNAKILVVGEAPGSEEVEKGIPFVGPSGKLLRRCLNKNGVRDTEVRFENVIERKLDGNDIGPLYEDSGRILPGPELKLWYDDLQYRVRNAREAKVILACGDTALKALTRLEPPRRKSLIGIYHCTPIQGYMPEIDPIILPVYHPAFILRAYDSLPWLHCGIKKAKKIADGTAAAPPRVKTLIPNDIEEALLYLVALEGSPLISIDIEVLRGSVACLALASASGLDGGESRVTSMSVPLSVQGGSRWSLEEEKRLWKALSGLLRGADAVLFQNFIFDAMYLSRLGLGFGRRTRIHDTMLAAAVLHPELPKKLGDLARVYTFAPAWKKEFDWGSITDSTELLTYNATDAALTLEIYRHQTAELKDRALTKLYTRHVLDLAPCVLRLCERGFGVSESALSSVRARTAELCSSLLSDLRSASSLFGLPEFNPNSPTQMKDLLLRMGYSVPTKDGKETTGKTALLKLSRRTEDASPFLGTFLQFKKASKLQSVYGNAERDPDGRFRCSINIGGTVSGRFSSSQTPWGTGLNSQNIPSRDPADPFNFRQVIVPDEGHTFVQVDLAQAEARVVAWLSRDPGLEAIFADGGDIHTRTASLIFGEDITKLEPAERKRKRYLGKKCVHAFNYGMAEATFADNCLTEAGLSIPVYEAKRLRESYFRSFPGIPCWHRSVQDELRRARVLRSPYSRERAFHGFLNEETFREAYSFLPQATVADTLNEAWLRLEERYRGLGVIQQGHDSLLIQAHNAELSLVVDLIREIFSSVSFPIYGQQRTIPFDIATGPNWRDMKEVACAPAR